MLPVNPRRLALDCLVEADLQRKLDLTTAANAIIVSSTARTRTGKDFTSCAITALPESLRATSSDHHPQTTCPSRASA